MQDVGWGMSLVPQGEEQGAKKDVADVNMTKGGVQLDAPIIRRMRFLIS